MPKAIATAYRARRGRAMLKKRPTTPASGAGQADEDDVFFQGVGDVLRKYREKEGVTLELLAERVGVNKSTLHRYETSETPVGGRMIKKIANGLRIKATTLMRDCLFTLRPKLKGSPFGKILNDLID